jgi:hypothetical protein
LRLLGFKEIAAMIELMFTLVACSAGPICPDAHKTLHFGL